MHIIAEDNYHFYGLWNKGMMTIEKNGKLINIKRSESLAGVTKICNLHHRHNDVSKVDVDLYEAESEDRLVSLIETTEYRIVTKKKEEKEQHIELFNRKVQLTFNKKSSIYQDIVVKSLLDEGIKMSNIEISIDDTFELPKEKVITAVKEWTGMTFDPESNRCFRDIIEEKQNQNKEDKE